MFNDKIRRQRSGNRPALCFKQKEPAAKLWPFSQKEARDKDPYISQHQENMLTNKKKQYRSRRKLSNGASMIENGFLHVVFFRSVDISKIKIASTMQKLVPGCLQKTNSQPAGQTRVHAWSFPCACRSKRYRPSSGYVARWHEMAVSRCILRRRSGNFRQHAHTGQTRLAGRLLEWHGHRRATTHGAKNISQRPTVAPDLVQCRETISSLAVHRHRAGLSEMVR